jgi:hypothetical protein
VQQSLPVIGELVHGMRGHRPRLVGILLVPEALVGSWNPFCIKYVCCNCFAISKLKANIIFFVNDDE